MVRIRWPGAIFGFLYYILQTSCIRIWNWVPRSNYCVLSTTADYVLTVRSNAQDTDPKSWTGKVEPSSIIPTSKWDIKRMTRPSVPFIIYAVSRGDCSCQVQPANAANDGEIFIAVCTKVCARAKLIKICIFRGWALFTPYLNNQQLPTYDFSISGFYSSIPIPQCSLYAEKPCNQNSLLETPHLRLCIPLSHFLVEIHKCKGGYQCRTLLYSA